LHLGHAALYAELFEGAIFLGGREKGVLQTLQPRYRRRYVIRALLRS